MVRKTTTGEAPEAPRTVRVRMLRTLRFSDGPRSAPRDIFGEQELTGPQAIAWCLLDFAQPVDLAAWKPDPRDCHEAAAEAMRWLETERGRYQSDDAFEAIPANARKLRAVLALVSDVNLGGAA